MNSDYSWIEFCKITGIVLQLWKYGMYFLCLFDIVTLFRSSNAILKFPILGWLFVKLMAFVHGLNTCIKEILLEIGFIEEMKSSCGNKEVPQTLLCHKIVKCRVANGTEVNELKHIFAKKENSEKRYRTPLQYLKQFSFL